VENPDPLVPPKRLCRTFGPVGLSYRQLEEEFRKRKKPSGSSWRVDETYIKVRGQWKYLTRAIDKDGATIEFSLTAKRDVQATKTIAGIEKKTRARLTQKHQGRIGDRTMQNGLNSD
jgi:hypothetical protein